MPDTKPRRIDHVGIAVRDLEAAIETYSRVFGSAPARRENVREQRVEVAAFEIGESSVELLQGTEVDSVISRFVDRHGEGLHHVCFEVEDVDAAAGRLESSGFEIVSAPSEGSGGTRVVFVHPRSAHGVLLELVQYPDRARSSGRQET